MAGVLLPMNVKLVYSPSDLSFVGFVGSHVFVPGQKWNTVGWPRSRCFFKSPLDLLMSFVLRKEFHCFENYSSWNEKAWKIILVWHIPFYVGNVITSERNGNILRWLLIHEYEIVGVLNLLCFPDWGNLVLNSNCTTWINICHTTESVWS